MLYALPNIFALTVKRHFTLVLYPDISCHTKFWAVD